MTDAPYHIFEKYQQKLEECNELIEILKLEKEILVAKLENANIKIELEKIAQYNQDKQALISEIKMKKILIADLKSKHKNELDAQNEAAKKALDSAMVDLKDKHLKNLNEAKKAFDIDTTNLKKKYELEIQKMEESSKSLKDEIVEKDKMIANLKVDKNRVPKYSADDDHSFEINNNILNNKSVEGDLKKMDHVAVVEVNNLHDKENINENPDQEIPDSGNSINNTSEELLEFERKINEILEKDNKKEKGVPFVSYKELEAFMKSGSDKKDAVLKYFSNSRKLISFNYTKSKKFDITMDNGKIQSLIVPNELNPAFLESILKAIGKSIISFEYKKNLRGKDFDYLIGPKLKSLYLHDKIGEGSKTLIRQNNSITYLEAPQSLDFRYCKIYPFRVKKLKIKDYTSIPVRADLGSLENLEVIGKLESTQNVRPMLSGWSNYFPKELKEIKFVLDICEPISLRNALNRVKNIEKSVTEYIPNNLEGSISFNINCFFSNFNEPEKKKETKKLIEEMNFNFFDSKQSKFYHVFKINNDRLTSKINFGLVDFKEDA